MGRSSRLIRGGLAALTAGGVIVLAPAVGLAALPSPGTFSGGCAKSACTLSFRTGKHTITNLSYSSTNCGGVSDSNVSIKINKKGEFSYAPPPPPESFVIDVSLKGKFNTAKKATGTITVLNYEQGRSSPTCKQTGKFTVNRT